LAVQDVVLARSTAGFQSNPRMFDGVAKPQTTVRATLKIAVCDQRGKFAGTCS
jgi:hypothetical protein